MVMGSLRKGGGKKVRVQGNAEFKVT